MKVFTCGRVVWEDAGLKDCTEVPFDVDISERYTFGESAGATGIQQHTVVLIL